MNVEAGLPLNASTWGAGLRGPVPYFFDGIWFMHQDTLVQLLLVWLALPWCGLFEVSLVAKLLLLAAPWGCFFMLFDQSVCRALSSEDWI